MSAWAVLQAPMFDGLAFDVGPLAQDVGGAAEVGVRRRHVAQALMVAGMGAIRTTLVETIAKRLLKGVAPRWEDRVIVTGLRRINWDDGKVEELCVMCQSASKRDPLSACNRDPLVRFSIPGDERTACEGWGVGRA